MNDMTRTICQTVVDLPFSMAVAEMLQLTQPKEISDAQMHACRFPVHCKNYS